MKIEGTGCINNTFCFDVMDFLHGQAHSRVGRNEHCLFSNWTGWDWTGLGAVAFA